VWLKFFGTVSVAVRILGKEPQLRTRDFIANVEATGTTQTKPPIRVKLFLPKGFTKTQKTVLFKTIQIIHLKLV
jgi:hypothetical protein